MLPARNFRAMAWDWYCTCKRCGGDLLDHPGRALKEKRGGNPLIRICSSCVLLSLLLLSAVEESQDE